MKAAVIHEHGGAEAIRIEDVPEPKAGPGEESECVDFGIVGMDRPGTWPPPCES